MISSVRKRISANNARLEAIADKGDGPALVVLGLSLGSLALLCALGLSQLSGVPPAQKELHIGLIAPFATVAASRPQAFARQATLFAALCLPLLAQSLVAFGAARCAFEAGLAIAMLSLFRRLAWTRSKTAR
jgi:hypothetical protein